MIHGSLQHLLKPEGTPPLTSDWQTADLRQHGGGGSHGLAGLHEPTSAERNELLAEVLARRPIISETEAGAAVPAHNWKVTARRWPAGDQRLWRVDVGAGCVNGEPARMTYLRENDPRGWQMPAGYPPFAELAKIYSPAYPFVDRSMIEDPAPFLLVTVPDASGTDLGGFELIPPARRPAALRGRQHWECDLYRASVWVSVTTWKVDPQNDLVRARQGFTQPRRWRVFAGRRPPRGIGVRAGAAHELARLWLLRKPGVPAADRLLVEQRSYWSLGTLAVEPTLGLGTALDIAEVTAEAAVLGLLGIGTLGTLGVAGLLTLEIIAALLLAELADVLESSGSTPFWSR